MRTITIPEPLRQLARDQAGLVSATQCDTHGVRSPTRSRLTSSGRWRRATRGVYQLPSTTPPPTSTSDEWALEHARQVWTAVLAAPSTAVVVGMAALSLHKVWGLPRNLPVTLAYRHAHHGLGHDGFAVRQFGRPDDTVLIGGCAVASMTTALIQTLPEVGRDLAVVLIDNSLNRSLINETDLDVIRRGVKGRRGAARLHQVWELVDGRAESPIETRARLECGDLGLPPDDLQVTLVDARDQFLGRGDMGWRRPDGSWVIAEMDGIEQHGTPQAITGDRIRQNAIQSRSTATVLRFTSADLGTNHLVRDVRRALATPSSREFRSV